MVRFCFDKLSNCVVLFYIIRTFFFNQLQNTTQTDGKRRKSLKIANLANKLAKLRRCASRVSFGSKSLGPINQPL